MGVRKKKGTSGEAVKYLSRNEAVHKLQLSLAQFRRLCILKGIYPREPKSYAKAQHGDTTLRTLYLRKDIAFLSHEPIIWKLREEKIYYRKLRTLRNKKEFQDADKFRARHKVKYVLDHIVLERFPTFPQALQDVDDALSTCFLFGVMPVVGVVEAPLVAISRRLTTEFKSYVIESRSLRKAFISIRGYFYRAHIQGQVVTWMVPHPFPLEATTATDLRVMKTFVEFYTAMLGFVNFKLYNGLNLHYPPKLMYEGKKRTRYPIMPMPAERQKNDAFLQKNDIGTSGRSTSKKQPKKGKFFHKKPKQRKFGSDALEAIFAERLLVLQSLNKPLKRIVVDDDDDHLNKNNINVLQAYGDKKIKMAANEAARNRQQMSLFEGVKFFLGRETNRESLTFVIRSAGGLVSWDRTAGPGYSYPEDDQDILYQIVDRPEVETKHLTRYYVQPQWVYDSFNAGVIIAVQHYFVGVVLPAHLSPFDTSQTYKPPELYRVQALQNKIKLVDDEITTHGYAHRQGGKETPMWKEHLEDEEKKKKKTADAELEVLDQSEEELEEEQGQEQEQGQVQEQPKNPLYRMRVIKPAAKRIIVDKRLESREAFRLASTFIHRKQKRLFKRILETEKNKAVLARKLRSKRIVYEKEMAKRKRILEEKDLKRTQKSTLRGSVKMQQPVETA